MKKSRIFLAATLALGIAGAVAAKAHTKNVSYDYFDSGSVCRTGSFSIDPCDNGTAKDCKTTVGGVTNNQLYTSTNATCVGIKQRSL